MPYSKSRSFLTEHIRFINLVYDSMQQVLCVAEKEPLCAVGEHAGLETLLTTYRKYSDLKGDGFTLMAYAQIALAVLPYIKQDDIVSDMALNRTKEALQAIIGDSDTDYATHMATQVSLRLGMDAGKGIPLKMTKEDISAFTSALSELTTATSEAEV